MPDLLRAASRARSAHVVSQRAASTRWSNGWQCFEKCWSETTTGSTKFWPAWKNRKEEKKDEQIDPEDRRRHAHSRDQAFRRPSRGRVPSPHRSEISPKMVARP